MKNELANQSRVELLHNLVEKLRKSEAEFASVINDVQVVVFTLDLNGNISFLNHAWSELSGYANTDAIGQSVSLFLAYANDDHQLPVSKVIPKDERQPIHNMECRLIKNDGQTIWCEYSAALDTKNSRVTGTLVDISASKKVERERRALDKSRADFYASISHDLRAPLLAVIGSSDQLIDGIYDDKAKSAVSSIRSCSTQLLSMLDEILEYSKLEVNEVKVTNKIFNLHELVSNTVHNYRSLAETKRNALKYTIDPSAPVYVKSDESKHRRILENLITNANKFTEDGDIHVALSASRGEQSFRLNWAVSDTGYGIPAEFSETLFEPYSQAHTQDGVSQGVGLGLAICSRLCALLGGDIRAVSDVGNGTEFQYSTVVQLADTTKVEALQARITKKRPDSVKVLIIEDDRTTQMILTSMLVSQGVTDSNIMIATTYADATAILDQDVHFDAIFVDCYLPDGSGADLTEKIRGKNQNGSSYTHIIACTASTSDQDRDSLVTAGVDDVLIKPVTKENLNHIMSHYFYW